MAGRPSIDARRRMGTAFAVVGVWAALGAPVSALAAAPDAVAPSAGAEVAHMVVGLSGQNPGRSARAAALGSGGRLVSVAADGGSALVEIPVWVTLPDALTLTKMQPGVRYAEPSAVYSIATVADPYIDEQWGLEAVRAPEAWGPTGDVSAIVAVLDTGVMGSHPDLAGTVDMENGYDFINSDTEADDDHGHGTHVAGIVAAVRGNGIGVAGVASGTRVLPVKVLDYRGNGTDFQVAEGVRYAADKGADVINMSLGSPSSTTVLQEAIDYARSKGCLVVAAAGNTGVSMSWYPAAYEGVIGCGSLDSDTALSSFSTLGSHVDVTAPGGDILSTVVPSLSDGYSYDYMSGTSMATPFVAGALALMRSADPDASAAELEAALLATAKDLGTAGRDNSYGHGAIDAYAAVLSLDRVVREDLETRAAVDPSTWTTAGALVTLSVTSGETAETTTVYTLDDGEARAYAAPFFVDREGVTTVSFSSHDPVNGDEPTKTAKVYVDRTPPVSTATPALGKFYENALITVRAADPLSGVASTRWTLDGKVGTGLAAFSATLGKHVLEYRSVDVAGNEETTKTLEFEIVSAPVVSPPGGSGGAVDVVAPVTTVRGVTAGWSSSTAALSLTAQDDASGVSGTWIAVDGGSASRYTAPLVVSAEGVTTVEYWSADWAGNVEARRSALVRIDRTAPGLALGGLGRTSTTATVSATATDALSGVATVEARVDGGAFKPASSLAIAAEGTHTVEFRATDAAGNSTRAQGTVLITTATALAARGPKTTVAYPAAAVITGTLTAPEQYGAGSARVRLQSLAGTRWVDVAGAETTVTSSGSYRLSFKPKANATVRAAFLGAGVLGESFSASVKVKVSAKVYAPKVPKTAKRNRAFTVSGKMAPAHASTVRLEIERLNSGRFRQVAAYTVKTRSTGAWSRSLKLSAGAYRVRAVHFDGGHVRKAGPYSARVVVR